MFAVVSLHCSFEVGKVIVYLFVNRNVDFGRSSPKNNHASNACACLEVADVLTNLLHHVPTVLASLHIVAIKTLCIVLVESSLHRNDLNQFVLNRFNILFLQHFAVDCAFVSVCWINVPCTEHDVLEVSDWNNVFIVEIFLVSTATYTNLVVLGHRTYWLCEAFACHEHTGHKCRANCSQTYYEDA